MRLNCCRSFGTHGDGKRLVIGAPYLIFNDWKMWKVLDFVKEKVQIISWNWCYSLCSRATLRCKKQKMLFCCGLIKISGARSDDKMKKEIRWGWRYNQGENQEKVCGVPLWRNTSSGTGRGLDCGCHGFSKISMYHKDITLNQDL